MPYPKRVQNIVVSRLRRILSNIEARETHRDNQTHVELETIKDGMAEIKDTLEEIKNATKDLTKAKKVSESHRNEKPQSETWFDYSLGTFLQSCLLHHCKNLLQNACNTFALVILQGQIR